MCKPHYIVHVVLLSLADVNVHGYTKYPQQFEAFAHMAGKWFYDAMDRKIWQHNGIFPHRLICSQMGCLQWDIHRCGQQTAQKVEGEVYSDDNAKMNRPTIIITLAIISFQPVLAAVKQALIIVLSQLLTFIIFATNEVFLSRNWEADPNSKFGKIRAQVQKSVAWHHEGVTITQPLYRPVTPCHMDKEPPYPATGRAEPTPHGTFQPNRPQHIRRLCRDQDIIPPTRLSSYGNTVENIRQQTLLYRYGKRKSETTVGVVAHVDGTLMQ